jgi:hypothetical protein
MRELLGVTGYPRYNCCYHWGGSWNSCFFILAYIVLSLYITYILSMRQIIHAISIVMDICSAFAIIHVYNKENRDLAPGHK